MPCLLMNTESVTPTRGTRSKQPFPSRFVGAKAVAPAWLCRYNARPGLFQVVKMQPVTNLFSYPRYWAECYGTAPFPPMSRAEMDKLGWDSCDIVLVTGDAYVDHPSFGMAVIGRMLESQGFRVGIIAQPDWSSKDDFMRLGKPNLFYGVTAGNMDSMINRYTADKKLRHDDAYTPGTWAASGRTALPWSTPSAARRPIKRCRWSSAASRHPCAASPTTTTGPRRSVAPSSSTPKPTSSSTATPSAPWWRWLIASQVARPSRPCRTFAAPPSFARSRCRAGAGSIRASSTRLAASIPSPTPIWKGTLQR